MDITIKFEIAQRIGFKAFRDFGVSEESWKSYQRDQTINLSQISPKALDDLEATLARFPKVRGIAMLLGDIKTFRKYLREGASEMKARSARQFAQLAERWLLKVPGHRLYRRHEEGAMFAYYVNEVEYHPPTNDSHRGNHPASVEIETVWEENGEGKTGSINIPAQLCISMGVSAVFASLGYFPETDELLAEYHKEVAVWVETVNRIGRQYLVGGKCEEVDEHENWYGRQTGIVGIDGVPDRVVVDLFRETSKNNRHSREHVHINEYFWKRVAGKETYDWEIDEIVALDKAIKIDDDEQDRDCDEEQGDKPTPKSVPINEHTTEPDRVDPPIHPWVVCFDLRKHRRIRVHINQLALYDYDTKLAEKLILPKDHKEFIQLLVENKLGAFRDIVQGKSGGTIVLLTGKPGVGKTLTAEVYAEAEERPLYSVQCSQLGTDPEELEGSLMNVFNRAKRWNAVLLLDEADVYVHERGSNMTQNAIVGVFLRVLEYQSSVMFLTTNRPDDVDDAIASRCIARLNYVPPTPEDAKAIWHVLSSGAGVKLDDAVIETITDKNRDMTGRDIKNLLKLVRLMPDADKGITVRMIEYVMQFKPTGAVATPQWKRGQAGASVDRKL